MALSQTLLQIRAFSLVDKPSVIQLWKDCGLVVPWNDPEKDIQRKLGDSPELFLVGEVEGVVVASVMGGYEGHRGWINYLAVSPDCRGAGLGKKLILHLEKILLERNCPKINLQVRSGNSNIIEYYEKLGYTNDNAVSMGKRLIPDD